MTELKRWERVGFFPDSMSRSERDAVIASVFYNDSTRHSEPDYDPELRQALLAACGLEGE